jgi:hypothetical protein
VTKPKLTLSAVTGKAKDVVAKHKKSCLAVVCLIVLVIILMFVWAHHYEGDGFVSKMTSWSSPDYKLLGKNNTNKTKRDDSANDNWSKDDFIKSVQKFNDMASVV